MISAAFVLALTLKINGNLTNENELKMFLKDQYEPEALALCKNLALAEWDYGTDLNNATKRHERTTALIRQIDFNKRYWTQYFKILKESDYKDELLRKQVKELKVLENAALDSAKFKELTDIQNRMLQNYTNTKICPYHNQDCDIKEMGIGISTGLEEIIANSMNYDRLLYIWEKWSNVTGAAIKHDYIRYVQLSNDAAKLNGFPNKGLFWLRNYDSPNFPEELDRIWKEVQPLYDDLHQYTLNKLAIAYEDQIDLSDGLIPAHVLGNMWGQSWVNLYHILKPYPQKKLNLFHAIKVKFHDIKEMFHSANSFFTSIGFETNEAAYNESNGAIIRKPKSGTFDCTPAAWDFCDGSDYRLKMCARVDYSTFLEIHNKMAQIAYARLYRNQPLKLRQGPNPAFLEAFSEAITLSINNLKYLCKIGVLKDYSETDEDSINALMKVALDKVAFLPFGLLVDKWRWDVFAGEPVEKWNSHWWMYRNTIQKIKSPTPRTEDNFDPTSKYHIPADTQYIKGGLVLGASRPWKKVLKVVTGENKLGASALIEYFQPLQQYLKEVNEVEVRFKERLNEYEEEASNVYNRLSLTKWNLAINPSDDETKADMDFVTSDFEAFQLHWWQSLFKEANEKNYIDKSLRRQIKLLKVIGNSALESEDLDRLKTIMNYMQEAVTTTKICPYSKLRCDITKEGIRLQPDVHNIMFNSTELGELDYYWKAWHEELGVTLQKPFEEYIALSNKAARINGFLDKGEMWQSIYDIEEFPKQLDKIWENVTIYEKLHRFVRRKLKQKYGTQLDVADGLIPAHVLGGVSGDNWIHLLELVKPYSNIATLNETDAIKAKGFTALTFFQIANEFYTSLGLESGSIAYDAKFERPHNLESECHFSAWDFFDQQDFRVLMCEKSTFEDFLDAHKVMGEIQYFIQYKDQPITLRAPANIAIQKAVGNAISLSARTPNHLKKLDIVAGYDNSVEASNNYLMEVALKFLPALASSLAVEKCRWNVFSGKLESGTLNSEWWIIKNKIQGIKSPITGASHHFDPTADTHVINDSPYIDTFVEIVLTFQIYRDMCIKARQYNPSTKEVPLHKCDFYESEEVGNTLRAGLSLGASKHWKVILELLTGNSELDATGILEYFEPLSKFLDQQNREMDEKEISNFLAYEYETRASKIMNGKVLSVWNYYTNVHDLMTEKAMEETNLKVKHFDDYYYSSIFQYLDANTYKNETIHRQVAKLKSIGYTAINRKQNDDFTNAVDVMKSIYSNIKVCPYKEQQCNLLEDGIKLSAIEKIFSTSQDENELKYYWNSWRNITSTTMKEPFHSYANLANMIATKKGFADQSEMWKSKYKSNKLEEDLDAVWEQIKPLYIELHRYVISRLKAHYSNIDILDGLIPAHLLGNLWGQDWENLASITTPYKTRNLLNITSELETKHFTARKMFDVANEFYLSLALESNERSYETKFGAIIANEKDEEIECDPSTWDFFDKQDFRVMMCAEVNHKDFITIHGVLSRIQYYLQYKNQPILFREETNSAFMQAVSDAVTLSVATPNHLKVIGFLENVEYTQEDSINMLMAKALQLIPFLPFGIIVEKWRWDVFLGKIAPKDWNKQWWFYRNQYQKLKIPDNSTEEFLDPLSKLHVIADTPYIQFPIGDVLSFQIYRSLCQVSGQYEPQNPNKPLHKCDFYKSKEAGKRLSDGLKLGSSKPWLHVLEVITGSKQLDGTAMYEYFQPLLDYLRKENKPLKSEQDVRNFLQNDYEQSATYFTHKLAVSKWNYETDVKNSTKKQAKLTATLNFARFQQTYWKTYLKHLNETDYKDIGIRRQVKLLRVVGPSALDNDKLAEFHATINEMTNIYTSAKVCPFLKQNCNLVKEGLTLTQDIEELFANSTDYKELQYLWSAWHAATGFKIKDVYPKYIKLSNEAATLNGFVDMGEMWKASYELSTFWQN